MKHGGGSLPTVIYQLWEDNYRERIARALGMAEKDDLKVGLLGDVRLYRLDIIHRRGRLRPEHLDQLGGEVDQVIGFEYEDIERLVRNVKAVLDAIVTNATGTDPELRTIWHLE